MIPPSDTELSRALDSLVLSASGWRGVFASSGGEHGTSPDAKPALLTLAALMADAFADYLSAGSRAPVALGRDTRPTGDAAATVMLRAFLSRGVNVEYLGIAAAPEIMAYAQKLTAPFVYISASHNPAAHNGVKFGFAGGVLDAGEEQKLRAVFLEKCGANDAVARALRLIDGCPLDALAAALKDSGAYKQAALQAYLDAVSRREKPAVKNLSVAADFNGSARSLSVDRAFFESRGIGFFAVNDTPGVFAHGIIPEGDNLECARGFLENLRAEHPFAVLAYACDCDGDRGNIAYYNEKTHRAEILSAQEVFALSVLGELSAASAVTRGGAKQAVVCNCPTSMRVDKIARALGASVFRCEVGEANAVSLADKKRREGFEVPISGEGSNGGSIVYPARVRDPLNTVSAILSLIRDGRSLTDVIESLPAYTTTGVSEDRAKLVLNAKDHAALKRAFQKEFAAWWESNKTILSREGIVSWTAIATNGTEETRGISDFGQSGKGGLKILFLDSAGEGAAFIWMRGSGTEGGEAGQSLFRVLCDVKGNNPALEAMLLGAERDMLIRASR
jgi:phosphoglucomutase